MFGVCECECVVLCLRMDNFVNVIILKFFVTCLKFHVQYVCVCVCVNVSLYSVFFLCPDI